MRTQDSLSSQLSYITYSIVNYIYHVVRYIPNTLSCNWKFVPFDQSVGKFFFFLDNVFFMAKYT